MRDKIDCAVLMFERYQDQVTPLIKAAKKIDSRMNLIPLDLNSYTGNEQMVGLDSIAGFPSPTVLNNYSNILRRFDCLIIPVMTESLAWTRMLLSNCASHIDCPIVVVGTNVHPIAFLDLLALGAHDFLLNISDIKQFRIRVLSIVAKHKRQHQHYKPVNDQMTETEEPLPLSMLRVNKPKMLRPRRKITRLLDTKGVLYSKGAFKQEKSRVVAEFERTYIVQALTESHGHIGLAAQKAQKHRRAFWELMRKYDIYAEDFKDLK